MRQRDLRKARQQKRERIAANDDTPLTWAEFYQQIDEVVTDESYQLDQLADANSDSKQINGSRG